MTHASNAIRNGTENQVMRCLGHFGEKPRFRVLMRSRMHAMSVPPDAVPGDLIVGNRGAAARVVQPPSQFGGLCACLTLEYVGNWYHGVRPDAGCKLYDNRGGT